MKIGLVRRGYSPTGGAEAYLKRFAAAAVAAGHDCVLYTTAEWPREEWPGTIERLDEGRSPTAFARELNEKSAQYLCDVLFSLERVYACDVYRAGDGIHAQWLGRRTEFEPGWKKWLRIFNGKHRELVALENALFRHGGTERVIANSRMIAEEIAWRFAFPPTQIDVVYNGVPAFQAPEGARAEMRQELDLAEDEYALLFAGTGWDRKGLRFAIAALDRAKVQNATLLVAGKGSSRSMPRSKRVRYLGPVSDMPRLLAAGDAFILPTIYDPFSNACLEALSAGLPVLTTARNGFSEIIEPGVEGEVVERPDDIHAMAEAIEQWADPQRRRAVYERLKALGAQYSIERNVRETLTILERQAERKAAG